MKKSRALMLGCVIIACLIVATCGGCAAFDDEALFNQKCVPCHESDSYIENFKGDWAAEIESIREEQTDSITDDDAARLLSYLNEHYPTTQ